MREDKQGLAARVQAASPCFTFLAAGPQAGGRKCRGEVDTPMPDG
ncbi:hypothetical protein RKD45_000111 [Streptomyces griseus]|nr:hypothetical protein F750_0139 [Streptomyces sp. PAMC 26508]MDF9874578.1 hypothetical protein [Streptomyces pratensis]